MAGDEGTKRRVRDFMGWPILSLYSSSIQSDVEYVRRAGLSGVACHADDLPELPLVEYEALSVQVEADSDLTLIAACSQLKALAIGGVKSAPVDLSKLSGLEVLRLWWHRKTILPNSFSQLRNLELRTFSPKSKDFAIAAPKLEALSIIQGGMVSLDGIQACEHLRSVSLSYLPKLMDVKALSRVRRVSRLEIDHCKNVDSYAFLESLQNLEHLTILDSAAIESLAFVNDMPRLRHLVLSRTEVANGDLSPLLGRGFDYLHFDGKDRYSHSLSEVKASELRVEAGSAPTSVPGAETMRVSVELEHASEDVVRKWQARLPSLLVAARERLAHEPGEAGHLYAQHHIEELGEEVWVSDFHLDSTPTVRQLLALLQPVSLWGDPSEELSLDFSIGEEHTDYVLSFEVHSDGSLGEMSMES